jgi:hypothetical protein
MARGTELVTVPPTLCLSRRGSTRFIRSCDQDVSYAVSSLPIVQLAASAATRKTTGISNAGLRTLEVQEWYDVSLR